MPPSIGALPPSRAGSRFPGRCARGELARGLLSICIWQERDGPPVVPPKHRGFGSRLLAASAQQIKGELDAQFAPEGLRCRFRFPVPARAA